MKIIHKLIIYSVVFYLVSTSCYAARKALYPKDEIKLKKGWTCFQFGLGCWDVDPIQIFNPFYNVYGLRINLLSTYNKNVNGVDLGVYGDSDNFYGFQANAVTNIARDNMSGVQVGATNFLLHSDKMKKSQAGGAQIGYANVSKVDFEGTQVGAINISKFKFCGVQFGVININNEKESGEEGGCIQIGLLNFNRSGFLWFFPFVNF